MIDNYWPFYIGGIAIAVIALATTILTGKFLSVTRGYAGLCGIISKNPYFHSKSVGGPFGVRTFFAIGIIAGGL